MPTRAALSLLLLALLMATGCAPKFLPAPVGPFGKDQFLAESYSKDWSHHKDELKPGTILFSDRLYCLDKAGKTRWSLSLDGYIPAQIASSPVLPMAAMTALSLPDKNGSRTLRVLLLDARGARPQMKVVRESAYTKDSQQALSITGDGTKIALLSSGPGATPTAAGETTAEVMDASGKTLWKLPIPPGRGLVGWDMDGKLETAALSLLANGPGGQTCEVLLCRPSSSRTLTFDSAPQPSVSPDGRFVALGYSAFPGGSQPEYLLSVYSWEQDPQLLWTKRGMAANESFSPDGRLLLCDDHSEMHAEGTTELEVTDTVQVLSAGDGNLLWEQRGKLATRSSWAESGLELLCFTFPADSGPPVSLARVDLSQAQPRVNTISLQGFPARAFVLSHDRTVALAIRADQTLVPVPIPSGP